MSNIETGGERERVQVREGMEKRDRYVCMYPAIDEQ